MSRTGPDGDSDDRVQAAAVAWTVTQYVASYSVGGLAARLYSEFRDFFRDNAVEYFVSHFNQASVSLRGKYASGW